MKVVVIGLYPPPFGGLSVHVQRLCYCLTKRSYEVTLFQVTKEKAGNRTPFEIKNFPHVLLLYISVLFNKCDVIHDHMSAYSYGVSSGTFFLIPFVMGLWLKRCRWVLSCGDGTLPKRASHCGGLYRPIYTKLFERVNFAIAKNREILSFFRSVGLQNRSKIIGTFLETNNFGNVPIEVRSFIEQHDYTVVTSGFMFQSVYNLDLVAKAVGRLKKTHEKYTNTGLIILASKKEDPVGKKHFDIAVNSSLEKEDLIILRDIDYALRVIGNCSVCVRVSNYDGDCNTIKEAMLMKIPVIASDLQDRPRNIVLIPLEELDRLDVYLYDTLEKDLAVVLVENQKHILHDMEQNFEDILAVLNCSTI